MTKLKPKHKEFAREYAINGNNARQAVKKVFKEKDDNYADLKGHRLISNDKVKHEIEKVSKSIAEQIPDKLLVKTQIEGLHASKKVFKNNNETGEVEEVSEEADYAVRHKYLDSAYKLKGAYAPEKSINVNVSVNAENREQMTSIAKEVALKLIDDETKTT